MNNQEKRIEHRKRRENVNQCFRFDFMPSRHLYTYSILHKYDIQRETCSPRNRLVVITKKHTLFLEVEAKKSYKKSLSL